MSRKNAIISISALLIALIPVIYMTNKAPLNTFDEARRAVNASEMQENGNPFVTYYAGKPDHWGTKPSLLVSLQALSMHFFGINRIAARLPSIIATLFLYLLLLFYTFRIGKTEWGWLSVMMLATAPGFINHHGARSADFEALLCLFLTMVIFHFYFYLKASTHRVKTVHFIITTVALTLACLTKGIAGLLFLPGLFIFTIRQKQLVQVLSDWRLWMGVVFFIAMVGGYYLLRYFTDPDYLKIVWQNEIGGRYGSTLETHAHPFYYYFALLFQTYFMPWIILTPLIGLIWKQKPVWFEYLLTAALSFILVISFAKTKLSWYLYPTLPLLALLTAPVLITIYHAAMSRLTSLKPPFTILPALIACLLLFTVPYTLGLKRIESRLEKDLQKGHIAYGHFVDQHFEAMDSTYIARIGYNPNVLFQVKRLQSAGMHIKTANQDTLPSPGQKLLVCDSNARQLLPEQYAVIQKTDYCLLVRIR
jgi:4-amino-4-deoxy-L-arabinose transferase-like glycosyltransferase